MARRGLIYVEAEGRQDFIEVKGVTLERTAWLCSRRLTERGVKHLNELMRCASEGTRRMWCL